jgi:enterochelin esterase family protein
MKNYTHWSALIVGMLGFVASPTLAPAQPAGPRPPQIVSPQVQKDGTVLFQLRAPKAQSVSLNSPDLGGLPAPGEMTKNDEGVWSLTYGPVTEGVALRYRFNVDGVDFADPSARGTSEANGTVFSLVTIPGAEFQDTRQVPHGAVAEVQYYSNVLGAFRRLHVYTPPGYEKDQKTYPVLYLLHGSSDSDDSWSTIGRANDILDNLIAAGDAAPMIVVMPDGHVTRAGVPNTSGASFEDEFARDIRPMIEKTYRTITDRDHRAIAGLSMGGAQTLSIAFSNLADFAYVGVFSSGIFPPRPGSPGSETKRPNWEEQHAAALDDAALKPGLKLLWFATGRDDFLIQISRDTVGVFKKHGFDVQFKETEGAHIWRNWRGYLHEFAPLLFQPVKKH